MRYTHLYTDLPVQERRQVVGEQGVLVELYQIYNLYTHLYTDLPVQERGQVVGEQRVLVQLYQIHTPVHRPTCAGQRPGCG